MPPLHDPDTLLGELQDNNAFFDSLVDMIPAKLYIAGNTGTFCVVLFCGTRNHFSLSTYTSFFLRKGDDKYNPKYYKGQHKESKEARRARSKAAKRAKFDPEQSETTRQVQERLQPAPTSAPPPPPTAGNSRIEALREKLHARLAEKASQRPSDPSVVSKRAARRAEKQRQKEEAKKKRASPTHVTKDSKKNFTMNETVSRVVDDLETVDFGKLAGLNPSPKHYQNNKALANLNKKKNFEKLLADAEQKRQKLEELKKGSEEDKEKALKMVWGDTLKEASGERVKDDPAKLKKELKRKLAKKQKSSKAWKSRLEQTREKMDSRQKIRKHNLDARKLGGEVAANLSKKRIVTEEDKEKRRSRPGFEGSKQGFLNKGKKNQ
jgi:DNA excision repair protein ERCC-4